MGDFLPITWRTDEDDRDTNVHESEEHTYPTRKRRKAGGTSKDQVERGKGQQKINGKDIERSEESLLVDGSKQQGGAEALLHPEGREYSGPTPIRVARMGPIREDEDHQYLHPEGSDDGEKLLDGESETVKDRTIAEKKNQEKSLLLEGWKQQG